MALPNPALESELAYANGHLVEVHETEAFLVDTLSAMASASSAAP